MKGISIFILVFVGALGALTLYVTREPDRDLDVDGRSWVAAYESWYETVSSQIAKAQVGLTFEDEAKNRQLLEPLRECMDVIERVGEPPELLEPVHEAAIGSCGSAEVALAKNDEFGVSAFATTRLHLNDAEDKLRLSQHSLKLALDEPL